MCFVARQHLVFQMCYLESPHLPHYIKRFKAGRKFIERLWRPWGICDYFTLLFQWQQPLSSLSVCSEMWHLLCRVCICCGFVFEHAYTHPVSLSAITWEFHDILSRHIWCILLHTVCTYTANRHMHTNVLFCKGLTDITGQKHPCICISMPQQILLCPRVPLCKQDTAPGLLRPHCLHKMMNLSWCPLVFILLWHP